MAIVVCWSIFVPMGCGATYVEYLLLWPALCLSVALLSSSQREGPAACNAAGFAYWAMHLLQPGTAQLSITAAPSHPPHPLAPPSLWCKHCAVHHAERPGRGHRPHWRRR